MALVAYEYDSDSGSEVTDEEEESSNSKVILNGAHKDNKPSQVSTQRPQDTDNDIQSTSTENPLFSNLPESKPAMPQISEENDQLEDFIPTLKTIKEKKKVQISIPSLREFDDPRNEEPLRKRVKPSPKGSGLLGMMPHAVRKKIETKKAEAIAKLKRGSDSETDEDEDIPIPDTFDDQMWEKVCGRPKPPVVVEIDETLSVEPEQFTIAPEPEKPYDGLDNKAFKELIGKTKKPIGNIKLIDINEDEIMSDKDKWMMKSLTDPELAPKAQVDDPVDPTRKRKHHITYLAQQARANEQELKSAWATSKSNRMMSRSKYGF